MLHACAGKVTRGTVETRMSCTSAVLLALKNSAYPQQGPYRWGPLDQQNWKKMNLKGKINTTKV